jgi:CRISPR-associated endonuclease Cas2
MSVLVVYRVRDPRRRRRLRTLLRSYGFEVAQGVYECPLGSAQRDELTRRIKRIVAKEDTLRLYRIQGEGRVGAEASGGPGPVTRPAAWYFDSRSPVVVRESPGSE